MTAVTNNMAQLYSAVSVSHGKVIASQHEQYQNPETVAAKWNLSIINIMK